MREEGGRFGRLQTVSVLQIGVFADQQEEEKHENAEDAEDAEDGLGSGTGWGDACGRRMATDARRNRRRVYGAVGRPIG